MSFFSNIHNTATIYHQCRKVKINLIRTIFYIFYRFINKYYKIDLIKQTLDSHRSYELTGNNLGSEVLDYIGDTWDIGNARQNRESSQITPHKENKPLAKEIVWFIPNCYNVWGGGHYTIFRFANYFANTFGANNTIYIYDHKYSDPIIYRELQEKLDKALPNCKLKVCCAIESMPKHDIAIATTWQSALVVKNFDRAASKFYFMQDYESLFYPAGSTSLLADSTYSFGFYGITGGTWLKSKYKSFGGSAQEYIFSTDKDIFYPARRKNLVRPKVKKIFFYGRPSTERRAFHLGIEALRLVSQYFPEIEIVIAGLDGLDKLNFKCTLLGNLSLRETGDLYRECDIGIALSATNLSYLPVELMASGCPVISNEGPQVEWYCKNNINSLVVAPTPNAIFCAAKSLIDSYELRLKLAQGGLNTSKSTSWEKEMDKIYHYIMKMCNPSTS